MKIRSEVLNSLDLIRKMRRDLHRIPEMAFKEHKTHEYIWNFIAALEPDAMECVGETGIKVVFLCKDAERTTAFRSDMDAMPITEETGLEFASQHEGLMHACGHDAHMATLLAFAKLVAENRGKLKENVVLIFQPAEENGGGAMRIIGEGVMESPHIDRVLGFHVYPGLPFGKIGLRPGPLMMSSTSINIKVRGKAAHGARPHLGSDAIVAAAHLITMIQSLVSRRIDPMENAVFSIGMINGGKKRNIICDEVDLVCTMRCYTQEVFDTMISSLKGMAAGLEYAFNCEGIVDVVQPSYLHVENDPELTALVTELAEDAAVEAKSASISEDFSFYQRKAQGMFAFLGVGEDVTALHTPTMYFDEEALLPMLEVYLRVLGI